MLHLESDKIFLLRRKRPSATIENGTVADHFFKRKDPFQGLTGIYDIFALRFFRSYRAVLLNTMEIKNPARLLVPYVGHPCNTLPGM
ncbi:MAG TPA: hypothetical protein DCS12_02970 [Clostridiales bacterium]|nr:hypothetical protein [Clostridiales bacterium]